VSVSDAANKTRGAHAQGACGLEPQAFADCPGHATVFERTTPASAIDTHTPPPAASSHNERQPPGTRAHTGSLLDATSQRVPTPSNPWNCHDFAIQDPHPHVDPSWSLLLDLHFRRTCRRCCRMEPICNKICLVGSHLDVLRLVIFMPEHHLTMQGCDEGEDLERCVAQELYERNRGVQLVSNRLRNLVTCRHAKGGRSNKVLIKGSRNTLTKTFSGGCQSGRC